MLEQHIKYFDGVTTQYVPEWQRGPLHTLVGVIRNVDVDDFLLCPSDCVIRPELLRCVLNTHRKNRAIVTMAVDTSVRRGTPVYLDDRNNVIAMGGVQGGHYKRASSAQVIIAGRDFASMCSKAVREGQSKVSEVIQSTISEGVSVSAVDVKWRIWHDVDDLRSLLAANRHLLETMTESQGSIVVHAGDVFETGDSVEFSSEGIIGSGVRMVGPTFIAKDCKLGDHCVIGPYASLGSNTTVAPNSALAHCITQNASVPKGHYDHCVIYRKHIITQGG